VATTLIGLAHALFLMIKTQPDLIVTNGPGTAVPLCYAHFVLSKVLQWRPEAKQIFVESFCRVTSLSLTGKLLKPIMDKFIVHWPDLKPKADKKNAILYSADKKLV